MALMENNYKSFKIFNWPESLADVIGKIQFACQM